MTQTILIIIGIAIIVILLTKKTREQVLRPAQDKIVGICSLALDQTVRKNRNKEKIATLLREKGQLSNADIREALGFSERSVVRYMNELEREGKIKQMGKTGRSVTYRLK